MRSLLIDHRGQGEGEKGGGQEGSGCVAIVNVGRNSRGSPSAISMAVIPRDHWSLYWDIMEGRGGEGDQRLKQ